MIASGPAPAAATYAGADGQTFTAADIDYAARAIFVLMSVLLLCAFSLFSAKSHEALDAMSLYNLSHPPAFARVNDIIQTTRVWCQRYRPSLDSWITQDRREEIMHAEENLRPGSEGAWERQVEFFMSPDGAQYFDRLGEQLSRMPPPAVPPSVA